MFPSYAANATKLDKASVRAVTHAGRPSMIAAGLTHWSILACLLIGAWSVQPAFAQKLKKRPFWSEIQVFLQMDKAVRPIPCRTLFVGSSSIRLWTSLKRDLPQRNVVRRGFGGAQLTDVLQYFDQLITPHRPREIVLYAGENDIAWGRSPDNVVKALQAFLKRKTETFGVTPVYFISIKPTVYHWDKHTRQKEANALIRRLAAQRSDLVYVDVASLMLEGGRPKNIFLGDRLHMNRDGYRLWTKAIGDALDQGEMPAAPHCKP
ncbi:MAG: GDSL-type esterase/lipase family protein [Pseudomonadota bacterium]